MQQGTRLRAALGVVTVAILAIAMLAPAGAAAKGNGNGQGNGNGHGQAQGQGNGNGHATNKDKGQGNEQAGAKHADKQVPAGQAAKDKAKGQGGAEDDDTLEPAGPAAAATGKGGVKRAASQACKRGGWREQQREDGTRFTNQGRCVSYAVRGGVLVAVAPTVTISFVVSIDPGAAEGSCDASATLADFDPATTYPGTLLVDGFPAPVAPITTDALGDAVVPLGTYTSPLDPLPQTTLNLTVDLVSSGDATVACPVVPEVPVVPII